jgi:hypothetical protein
MQNMMAESRCLFPAFTPTLETEKIRKNVHVVFRPRTECFFSDSLPAVCKCFFHDFLGELIDLLFS